VSFFGLQEELDDILVETDECPQFWADMIEDLTAATDLQHEDFAIYREQPQREIPANPMELGENQTKFMFIF
jgi:hypothetical protein